jgi:hypothetical protein
LSSTAFRSYSESSIQKRQYQPRFQPASFIAVRIIHIPGISIHMPGILIHILPESLFTSPRNRYSHAPEYALSYTIRVAVNLEGGDYGKSNQRASGASRRAQASTVALGEVGSSNFSDRVVKWFGSIPRWKPTEANYLCRFASKNGAGAKSEMGKDSQGTEASGGSDGFGSRERSYNVGVSPEENRGGTAGTVGEVEGAATEPLMVSRERSER